MLDIDDMIKIATLIATPTALITAILAVLEFRKNGALRRSEHFAYLNEKLYETDKFIVINDLLQNADPAIEFISDSDKTEFIGIYEIVALSVNSGLLREDVAFYMFGYYAIECWNSHHFWNENLEKNSPYWHLFHSFVVKMEKIEASMSFDPHTARY